MWKRTVLGTHKIIKYFQNNEIGPFLHTRKKKTNLKMDKRLKFKRLKYKTLRSKP